MEKQFILIYKRGVTEETEIPEKAIAQKITNTSISILNFLFMPLSLRTEESFCDTS